MQINQVITNAQETDRTTYLMIRSIVLTPNIEAASTKALLQRGKLKSNPCVSFYLSIYLSIYPFSLEPKPRDVFLLYPLFRHHTIFSLITLH